jgi:hypothetical protein
MMRVVKVQLTARAGKTLEAATNAEFKKCTEVDELIEGVTILAEKNHRYDPNRHDHRRRIRGFVPAVSQTCPKPHLMCPVLSLTVS